MIKTDTDDVKIKECFLIRIKVEAAVLGVILLENLQRKQDFEFLPFIVSFRKFSMWSFLSDILLSFGQECLCAGRLGPRSRCWDRGCATSQRRQPGRTQTPWDTVLLGAEGAARCGALMGCCQDDVPDVAEELAPGGHAVMVFRGSPSWRRAVLAHAAASNSGPPAAGSQPCMRAAGLMESPGRGGAVSSWLHFIEQENFIFSKQCQLERDCSMAASQWRATAAGTALKDPICGGVLLGPGRGQLRSLLLLQLMVLSFSAGSLSRGDRDHQVSPEPMVC